MTLPSLRPVIAEIMVHTIPVSDDPGAWLGHLFGAETLHWCDERERGEEDAQCEADEGLIDTYEGTLNRLEEALDSWIQVKLKRPAEFRDEVRKILDNVLH